jgi:4-diphosphocytidyl-2-C-methyl-D-erythritol kinase
MPVVRLAPAKVNLTLAVVGRRDDGFHALHSVMAPLDLADRLTLSPLAPPASGTPIRDTLHVDGLDAGPTEQNLVLRAIALARDTTRPVWAGAPAVPPPIAARLEKRIPVSAGLAGGSSDGAAALLGTLEAWSATLEAAVLVDLAARLGSDVPFFLADGLALVEGRGERVTRLSGTRGATPAAVLLVTPAVAVSTARVFDAYAAGARPADPASTLRTSVHLADELAAGMLSPDLLAARAGVLATANDLAAATAVVEPALPPFRRRLARLLGRPVGQSGSGPTLWVLYPSLAAAQAAAAAVDDAISDGRLEPPGADRTLVTATSFAATTRLAAAAPTSAPAAVARSAPAATTGGPR